MTPKPRASHAKDKARILIVDDHPIVREGLALRLNHQPDMEVCGEADSVPNALKAITDCRPDLAVVDLTLRGRSGLELIKDLHVRHPKLPVLVLSMHDESLYAERALRAGARGYIMKQEAADHVVEAIHRILAGKVFLSEKMAARLLDTFVGGKTEPAASPAQRLSDRELQVFELIGRGFSTRRIAETLHVSVKTAEAYRANIKRKLELKDAAELTRRAVIWVEEEMEA